MNENFVKIAIDELYFMGGQSWNKKPKKEGSWSKNIHMGEQEFDKR